MRALRRHPCRAAPPLILLLLVLVARVAVAGQQRTGTLEVRWGDFAGQPIPGAVVQAEAVDAAGSHRCTTREDGRCVMLGVAPGRYRIVPPPGSASTVAFALVAPGGHALVLLSPSSATAAADAAVRGVDPSTIDHPDTLLGRDALADLAAGRGLFDALRVDPTQPSTGNWWRGGEMSAWPRLFVEGTEWPASVGGGGGGGGAAGLQAGALEVVRVDARAATGASSPRGTSGGVIATWRAGGARFSGDVSLAYEGWRLNGAPRRFARYSPWDSGRAERNLTVPVTPWTDVTPTIAFGGPLGTPGLSFHVSGASSRRTHHREVIFLSDPDRLVRGFSWYSWSGQGSATLTAAGRGGRRARLALSFARSRNRGGAPALEPDQGRLPEGTSTAGLTRSPFPGLEQTLARWRDIGSDSRRFTLSPSLDWPLGDAWSIGASAAWSFSNSWTPAGFRSTGIRHVFASSNARTVGVAPDDIHPSGYADRSSSYGTVRDAPRRALLALETTWAPGRRVGHVVSAGLRVEREADTVYIGHESPVIRLHWNQTLATAAGARVTGQYGYYTVSRPGTIGRGVGTLAALWLQDRWSAAPDLTIEAGLRSERAAVASYVRHPDARSLVFGFDVLLAPRLSAVWKPDGAGVWRVESWFGIYLDHLTTQLARSLFGARHDVRESWTLDTLDWRAIECDEGRRDCPGQFIERVDRHPAWNVPDAALTAAFGPGTRIDPGLRPMQTGEWGGGVERTLPGRASLALRYTGKWLIRALEDVGVTLPSGDETAVLANPGFGYAHLVASGHPDFALPAAARRYHEVEVEFRRRGRPVSLTARYRWSRLTGNYGGLAASDEGGRQSTNLTSAFDSVYSSYDRFGRRVDGLLPGDRPHRLGLDATLAWPSGTTVAVSGLIESGRPESSQISFRGTPIWFNGYGDLGRQPAFSQLDLRLRQDVRFGRHVLSLEATVDNVFDQSATLGFFSTSPYRDDLALPPSSFFETPWDPAAWADSVRAAGGRVRDEQLFLEPNRFQRPRRVTVSAGLGF